MLLAEAYLKAAIIKELKMLAKNKEPIMNFRFENISLNVHPALLSIKFTPEQSQELRGLS